jgi:hypothetical protein
MSSQNPNRAEERRSDLAVMDANEFKQKRRLERILDSLHAVEDKADVAWEWYAQGEISEDAKNIMVQRAVQKAIREVYNLLREGRENGAKEYWEGTDDEIGLYSFMQADVMQAEEITQTVSEPNKPPEKVTQTQETTIDESISWAAYLRLKEFLQEEHDLEIQFEELEDSRPQHDWREDLEDGVYRFEEVHDESIAE